MKNNIFQTKETKLISIIIPAHNEENAIEKCLLSIKSQKAGNVEIIVVNDGSSDKTSEIAEKTKVCDIIINFDKGHSAAFARNAGAKAARGKYLVFIDADQIIGEKFVAKTERFLKENPEADGSDYLAFSYNPKTIFQRAWSAYRQCYPSMGLVHIIRKNVFRKLGGFDENVFYFEDTDLMKRFHESDYKFIGPINTEVYHIEPETWKDFIRQRKWQGRQAPMKYFLPCLFPPVIIVYFFKVWRSSGELRNAVSWILLDFLGRYISLYERIKISLFSLYNFIQK